MEPKKSLKKHFAFLALKGYSIKKIMDKMNLTLDEYDIMSEYFIRNAEIKAESQNKTNDACKDKLNFMWSRINQLIESLNNEKDYSERCLIEAELEKISIKYAQFLHYEITIK